MANPNVGMMYPVFAPIASHTDGSMPTYGTGVVIQEARNCTISKTYNNNPLHLPLPVCRNRVLPASLTTEKKNSHCFTGRESGGPSAAANP